MLNLPLDLLEEDELLAEFHRAGLLLPEERERHERALKSQALSRDQARLNTLFSAHVLQNLAFNQQNALAAQLNNPSNLTSRPHTSALGALGGLGLGFFRNF